MHNPATKDRRLGFVAGLLGVLTIAVLPAVTGCANVGERAMAQWPPDDIAAELAPLPRDDPRAGVFPESRSSR